MSVTRECWRFKMKRVRYILSPKHNQYLHNLPHKYNLTQYLLEKSKLLNCIMHMKKATKYVGKK
jgi:hypothetical protein